METEGSPQDGCNSTVTASVNGRPVKLHGKVATGHHIKTSAIEQGVPIEAGFELLEELPDGKTRVVTDKEEVHLRDDLRFTAVEKEHVVTVSVNGQPVKLHGKVATGHQIKTSAIEQGVPIEEDFELLEELPDGKTRVVTDKEEVHLRDNLRFTAVKKEHAVTVLVNEQPVKLLGKTATGAQIKSAAIAQGVLIQQNFVLQEELPNGTSRVIGDTDVVHLREHLRFTAIAPDDNS